METDSEIIMYYVPKGELVISSSPLGFHSSHHIRPHPFDPNVFSNDFFLQSLIQQDVLLN